MSDSEVCVCQICDRHLPPSAGTFGDTLRPTLSDFIHKERSDWSGHEFICFDDLARFRKDYLKQALEQEIGELSALDQEVVESLQQHEILTENIEAQFERKLSLGERLSDRIADFGGSWVFIIIFVSVLVTWIAFNAFVLANRGFDPYPFIFLNLLLSCIAAIQAPVIMMSQNRAEARDRLRGENDYKVNLKAELEIRHVHEKLDHLLRRSKSSNVRSAADPNRVTRTTGAEKGTGSCELTGKNAHPALTLVIGLRGFASLFAESQQTGQATRPARGFLAATRRYP